MNNLNNQTNVVRLEKTIAEAKEKFNGLLDFSLASRDFSPYKFEKQLFQMLLALGKIFLQIFFISFGIGDVGRKILNEKSEALTRYRSRSIDYTCIKPSFQAFLGNFFLGMPHEERGNNIAGSSTDFSKLKL